MYQSHSFQDEGKRYKGSEGSEHFDYFSLYTAGQWVAHPWHILTCSAVKMHLSFVLVFFFWQLLNNVAKSKKKKKKVKQSNLLVFTFDKNILT